MLVDGGAVVHAIVQHRNVSTPSSESIEAIIPGDRRKGDFIADSNGTSFLERKHDVAFEWSGGKV